MSVVHSTRWLAGALTATAVTAAALVPAARAPRLSRTAAASSQSKSPTPARRDLAAPLLFEANQGQAAASVRFLSRGPGYGLYLTGKEAVFALRAGGTKGGHLVRMELRGASAEPAVEGCRPAETAVHYYHGSDPARWRPHVATFEQVKYGAVYPGVDLLYYGSDRSLEYDFVVRPGARPEAIRLGFRGIRRLEVGKAGDLVLHTAAGKLRQAAPVVYQERAGVREAVAGRFLVKNDHEVGFEVGSYDRTRTLVIDPKLDFSTFAGGSGEDRATGVAVDAAGDSYVTGTTFSANFPVGATSGFSVADGTFNAAPYNELFVRRYSAAGALKYSTFLGGSNYEEAAGIAVDSQGRPTITGSTQSGGAPASSYPTTAGAFQRERDYPWDAILTRLNANGTLNYSTFIGGREDDRGYAVAVDEADNAYVVGRTKSNNFPYLRALIPPGGYNSFRTALTSGTYDAFLVQIRMDAAQNGAPVNSSFPGVFHDLKDLRYLTLFGGYQADEARAVAFRSGTVYVGGFSVAPNNALPAAQSYPEFPIAGSVPQATRNGPAGSTDGFVTALKPAVNGAGSLAWSTFLGGNRPDQVNGLAVNGAGAVYAVGTTQSLNFPVSGSPVAPLRSGYGGGATDAFFTELSPTGNAVVYSGYLGGSYADDGLGIAADGCNAIYLTGSTASPNLTAIQPLMGYQGDTDLFLAKLDQKDHHGFFSTHLGTGKTDVGAAVAADACGVSAVVAGWTSSTAYPVLSAAQPSYGGGTTDALVTRIGAKDPPLAVILADGMDIPLLEKQCQPGGVSITLAAQDPGANDSVPVTYRWCLNGQMVSESQSFGQTLELGTYVYTLIVTDSLGEQACDTVTVEIVDETPPKFTFCPADVDTTTDDPVSPALVGQCYASGVVLGTPTAEDDCSNPVTIVGTRFRFNGLTNEFEVELDGMSNPRPLTEPYDVGVTLVLYKATDAAGNSTITPASLPFDTPSGQNGDGDCVQRVTVVDDETPQIIGSDVMRVADPMTGTVVIPFDDIRPLILDNCPDLFIFYLRLDNGNDPSVDDVYPVGQTEIAYLVDDGTNLAMYTQVVEVTAAP